MGESKSDKPTRCSISVRTRSMTAKATSAPSCVGSIWTLKGRLPKGVSTTLAIAAPTADASASGGTMAAKALCICSPRPLLGPASYSARRDASAGRPECAKWFVPPVKAPGTMIEVSMPQRVSSRAYCTASASIAALAAKYGAR